MSSKANHEAGGGGGGSKNGSPWNSPLPVSKQHHNRVAVVEIHPQDHQARNQLIQQKDVYWLGLVGVSILRSFFSIIKTVNCP